LYVSNFSAGFGHVWLDKAIERFEKAYANVSFESGKTGVKVVADNNRNSAQTILNGIEKTPSEVFFMEGATYNDFVTRNVLLDISDVVKSKAGSDTVTIESKLTDEQKGFYSKSGKYYGLPHYAGYMGTNYDKDSFAQNGYYFAGDSAIIQGYNTLTSNDKYIFATSALQKKSNGPDGLPGTYDDGLPSTYDEFFALCDHIVSKNKKAITWNGIAPVNYLENLMQSLASTSDGKEQTMLNYEVWGTAETLGNYAMGGFVRDSEPTVIVGSTAKELARQKGKYDALSFMHKLIQAKAGIYYPSSAMGDPTYTQYDSQDDFLYGARNGGQYPMMIDGAWWQGEATESINKMVENYGNSYSKQNRNFGFMPYPKPDESYVGKDNVLYDHLTSLCCVKSGLTSAKQTMAKEFVRFMYSHESLFEFTKCTDVPKAVNYELSASEKNQLTPFAKSLCEVKEDSQIVYPISKSNLFVNVPTAFTSTSMFMGKMYGNNTGAINAIMAGANVNEFFASMYTYRQELTYNW
jgi:maltose-binding protein MalE